MGEKPEKPEGPDWVRLREVPVQPDQKAKIKVFVEGDELVFATKVPGVVVYKNTATGQTYYDYEEVSSK